MFTLITSLVRKIRYWNGTDWKFLVLSLRLVSSFSTFATKTERKRDFLIILSIPVIKLKREVYVFNSFHHYQIFLHSVFVTIKKELSCHFMLNWDFFCVRKKKKTAVEVRQWFAIFWRLTWNDCVYIPWNVWIVYFQTLWFFNLDEEGGVINAQRLCFYVKTRFDNLLSYNKKGYLCNNRKWSNFPI